MSFEFYRMNAARKLKGGALHSLTNLRTPARKRGDDAALVDDLSTFTVPKLKLPAAQSASKASASKPGAVLPLARAAAAGSGSLQSTETAAAATTGSGAALACTAGHEVTRAAQQSISTATGADRSALAQAKKPAETAVGATQGGKPKASRRLLPPPGAVQRRPPISAHAKPLPPKPAETAAAVQHAADFDTAAADAPRPSGSTQPLQAGILQPQVAAVASAPDSPAPGPEAFHPSMSAPPSGTVQPEQRRQQQQQQAKRRASAASMQQTPKPAGSMGGQPASVAAEERPAPFAAEGMSAPGEQTPAAGRYPDAVGSGSQDELPSPASEHHPPEEKAAACPLNDSVRAI